MENINVYSVGATPSGKSSAKGKEKKKRTAGKTVGYRTVRLFGADLFLGPYIYVSKYASNTYIMVKKNFHKPQEKVYSSVKVTDITEARVAVVEAAKLLGYAEDYLQRTGVSIKKEASTVAKPAKSKSVIRTEVTEKSLVGDLQLFYAEARKKLEGDLIKVNQEKDALCNSIMDSNQPVSLASIVSVLIDTEMNTDFKTKFKGLEATAKVIRKEIQELDDKVETLNSFIK